MDVIIAIVLAIALLRTTLSAIRRYRAFDVIDKIYEQMQRYGDLIHIAYGIFVARLFDYARSMPAAATAAVVLASLYVVYQIVEDLGKPTSQWSAAKDIAVFTAALTVTLASLWGIPLNVPIS